MSNSKVFFTQQKKILSFYTFITPIASVFTEIWHVSQHVSSPVWFDYSRSCYFFVFTWVEKSWNNYDLFSGEENHTHFRCEAELQLLSIFSKLTLGNNMKIFNSFCLVFMRYIDHSDECHFYYVIFLYQHYGRIKM